MTALSIEPLSPVPSGLRLVPAPASMPPYDDETGPGIVLRLVTTPVLPESAYLDDDAWVASTRTPTAQLPPSRVFARGLVQGVLEALAGVRAVKQLQRDTTPELYTDLAAAIALGRTHHRDGRATRPGLRAIRSLHVQERPEGIVEACATVVRDGRVSALALRLEGLDGRWRCTELVGV